MKLNEYEITNENVVNLKLSTLNKCRANLHEEIVNMEDGLEIFDDAFTVPKAKKIIRNLKKHKNILEKELNKRDYYYCESENGWYLDSNARYTAVRWAFETSDEALKVVEMFREKQEKLQSQIVFVSVKYWNAYAHRLRTMSEREKDAFKLIDYLKERNDYCSKIEICEALDFPINENKDVHDVCNYLWELKTLINTNVEKFNYQIVSNRYGDMKIPTKEELINDLQKEKLRLARQWKRLWLKEKSLKLINAIDLEEYVLKVVSED